MPRQFERYRFRDGITPLDEATFNRVLADLDLRLAALEDLQIEWESALSMVSGQGLTRVAAAMSGPLADLTGEVAALSAQIAAAQQEGMLLDGPDTVDDGNLGERTIADATPPAGNTATLTTLLGGLANRLKAITGAASWRDTPATTLAALASAFAAATSHIANKTNPHQVTAAQVGAAAVGGSAAQVYRVADASDDMHAVNRRTGDVRYLRVAGGAVAGAVTLGGGATLGGALAGANHPIAGVKTLGYHAEYDNGDSGSAKTITLANGAFQRVAVSQNGATLTVSTAGAAVGTYRLRIVNGGSLWNVSWSGILANRWLRASSTPAIRGGSGSETLVEFYFNGSSLVQQMNRVGAT